jgi:hypothetical protein
MASAAVAAAGDELGFWDWESGVDCGREGGQEGFCSGFINGRKFWLIWTVRIDTDG